MLIQNYPIVYKNWKNIVSIVRMGRHGRLVYRRSSLGRASDVYRVMVRSRVLDVIRVVVYIVVFSQSFD